MPNGIDYTVKPGPDGRKIRYAISTQSGEVLDAVPLSPPPLSAKARSKRRKR